MSKIKDIAKRYIYKGKELEEDYGFNIQWATTVALILMILMFLFVKNVKVEAYQAETNVEVQVEEIPEIERIEEPPPPPKPKLPPQIEEATDEEAAQEEEEIEFESTEFNELETPPPPQIADTAIDFFKVEVKPKLVKAAKPEYPEIARKAGIEGRVVVLMIVDTNGNVVDAKVLQSTNEIFNEPALKAAYQHKFTPAMMKDRKVKVKVIRPFVFKLQG